MAEKESCRQRSPRTAEEQQPDAQEPSAPEQAHEEKAVQKSADDAAGMPKAPKVWVAYLLFFSGGVFGVHHIYLRRPFQV